MLSLGLDLGSTTVKYVLLDSDGARLAADYRRHRSAVLPTLAQMLEKPCREYGGRAKTEGLSVMLTGSGALRAARALGLPFCQEVVAAAA